MLQKLISNIIQNQNMSVYPEDQLKSIQKNESASNFSKKKLSEKCSDKEMSLSTKKQEKGEQKCVFIKKLMQNIVFQIIITLITIVSLFMEDIRVIFFQKDLDKSIDGVNLAFIVIFSVQIIMSLTINGYFCSFFFYLDILSTCSILMDISILTNLLYTSDGSENFQLNILITQSKASRAAARAVRVMKIFRLTRVVKLYKSAMKTKQLKAVSEKQKRKQEMKNEQLKKMNEALKMEEKQNESKSISMRSVNGKGLTFKQQRLEILDQIRENSHEESGGNEEEIKTQSSFEDVVEKLNSKESKIGKLLSESTIKKVIIVILFLMFSVPIFDVDNYYPEDSSWDFLVGFVGKALDNPNIPLWKINQVIRKNIQSKAKLQIYSNMIIFQTPFTELPSYNLQKIDNLRITDIGIAEYEVDTGRVMKKRPGLSLNGNDGFVTVIVDYHEFNKIDSIFSIVKIVFICLIIMYLLNSFNDHTSELIIDPIQKMVEEIRSKGETFDVDYEKVEENQNNNYETTNVHKAITKISFLMLKVFGSIAFESIYKKIFAKGTIVQNYLQQSKHHYFIFGICTISDYDQLAEILQDQIFQLSNDVVKYLHSAAFRYGGTGIINCGRSFIVVFPSPKEDKENSFHIQSDFSVFAFVKTLVKINKQHEFLRYRKDPRLITKMGDNFQIQISCLLHSGWAYEGLMGSAYKIDPTYIGKPLTDLQKLMNFCKVYPNSLFLTSELHKNLTVELKKLTRIVDLFEINGLSKVQLYMVDMDLQNISPPKSSLEKKNMKKDKHSIHLKRELNLEYVKNEVSMKNYHASIFVNSKKELREVLKNVIKEEYKKKYAIIYEQYDNRRWNECKENLEDILIQNSEDILTQRIYEIIQSQNCTAPAERQEIKCFKKYSYIN